jgi:hypothetical protein
MALKRNFYGEVRDAMEQSLLRRGLACTRPRGCYWYSINEETLATVGLNESKWRGETRLEIIPSIGVTNQRINALMEELCGKSKFPLPSQIGMPLGFLMPDPGHKVWKYIPDVDIYAVAENLAENVIGYGIP